MSLVLSRRPAPVRNRILPGLVLLGLFASALSLAPGVTQSASDAAHKAVCACPSCEGGPQCCCLLQTNCPVRVP